MVGDPFWSNIFEREQSEEDALFEILTQIPIFQDFSQREFKKNTGNPTPPFLGHG